jgi:hypothetical protein
MAYLNWINAKSCAGISSVRDKGKKDQTPSIIKSLIMSK